MSATPEYSGGKRNRYRAGMPWSERATKDLKAWFGDLKAGFSGKSKLQLVTYPDYPSKRTTIFKIAGALGARLSNIPTAKTDVVLYFHDATHKAFADVPGLPLGVRVINGNCHDISKTKVDAVHLEVFGYNTFVDPLSHTGPAVEKSDDNAMHDGRVVTLPIATSNPGSIYQVVIDNAINDAEVVDMRVPVIGGQIPLVYRKYKAAEVRFTNEVSRSELHTVDSQLNTDEVSRILTFCEAMGAEFCELDVLRDNASGKIYVIDVNTTPYGPPAGLSGADFNAAMSGLVGAFRGGSFE